MAASPSTGRQRRRSLVATVTVTVAGGVSAPSSAAAATLYVSTAGLYGNAPCPTVARTRTRFGGARASAEGATA